MDTNTIALLIELMRDRAAPNAIGWSSIVQIVVIIIGAVIPTIAALKASSNSQKAADTAASFKDVSTKTAESVEKVHIAVNSERTAMKDEMKALRELVLSLSQDKSKLEEHQRGKELSEARQAGQQAQQLPPSTEPIKVQVTNPPGAPVPVKTVEE